MQWFGLLKTIPDSGLTTNSSSPNIIFSQNKLRSFNINNVNT